MDINKYNFIKNKHGIHASWAVWAEEANTPKSNMGDLSVFDDENILQELNPNIVLVALNFSVAVADDWEPFQNFHGKGGGAYKIRYAVKGTPFWGAYMTDIIKDFPEKESNNVMTYLKDNPSIVADNIISFEQELEDIGSIDPLLICFGTDSFNILNKNLGEKYNIQKVTHYSHFESKEIFRDKVLKIIEETVNPTLAPKDKVKRKSTFTRVSIDASEKISKLSKDSGLTSVEIIDILVSKLDIE